MNAAPFALYALGQIRQQEIERNARTAWQRVTRDAPRPGPRARRRRPPRRRGAGMLTGVERAVELRPGLWRWDAYHPSYQQDVTSVLVATDDDVVLVDPLAPRGADGAPFWRALDEAVERGPPPHRGRDRAGPRAELPGDRLPVPGRRRSTSRCGARAGRWRASTIAPLEESTPLPAGDAAYETGRARRARDLDRTAADARGRRRDARHDDGGLAICPAAGCRSGSPARPWRPARAAAASSTSSASSPPTAPRRPSRGRALARRSRRRGRDRPHLARRDRHADADAYVAYLETTGLPATAPRRATAARICSAARSATGRSS